MTVFELDPHHTAPSKLGAWLLRAPLAALFAFSALTKMCDLDTGFAEMTHFGLPTVVLFPLIAFQFGGAVALLTGLFLRPASLALAAFVFAASVLAHWPIVEGGFDIRQATVFLEHLVIIAGLIALGLAAPAIAQRRSL